MEIFEFRYCMQLLELSRRYPFKAHVWIGVFELFFVIWLLILEEEWHIIWFWAGQIVKVLFFSGFMNTHLIGSASNWMLATPFFFVLTLYPFLSILILEL